MTAPQHTTTQFHSLRKSSHSTGQTDCDEVAQASAHGWSVTPKNPDAARPTFAADIWQHFAGKIRNDTHQL